jgi:hypothetical protein
MTTRRHRAPLPTRKPAISDEAVAARTGRNWNEWFDLLDRAGGRSKSHTELVAILSEKHGLGPWWQQMVAVAYEQSRGLRDAHQRPDGYQISKGATLAAPLARVFAAWSEPRLREQWLKDTGLVVRKATPHKSLRITWTDGTHVDVMLVAKGHSKTQVTVNHGKLKSARAAESRKSFWRAQLERLRSAVER